MTKLDAPLHVLCINISLYRTTVSAFVAMLIQLQPSIVRLQLKNAVTIAWEDLGGTWCMELNLGMQ